VLEALVDRLVPADENGPGAAQARVTRYIARALAGHHAARRDVYAAGLAAVDAHARSVHGRPFAELEPDRQDTIVTDLERGLVPGCAGSSSDFFELVRTHTIEGLMCDPSWGGNADLIGWKLIGYPGPRIAWTEEEQQILGPEA
jgi:gluconate 2-dehydrogenase gamma chain